MKRWVLLYAERGDRGELIHHKEVFFSRIAARINFWFSCKDRRRVVYNLIEEEVDERI